MKKNKQMSNDELCSQLDALISDAKNYQDFLAKDRLLASEYYDGVMNDMPTIGNWSKTVVNELRSTISKALPSLLRVILGSDKVVEFQPVGQGDEALAEQVTEYFNKYILEEIGAKNAIYDSGFDSFLFGNGVLHWYIDERVKVEGGEYSGLSDMALSQFADDNVEILEQSSYQSDDGSILHDIKIKRTVKDRRPTLVAIPLDDFLISPDALSVDSAALVGRHKKITRSDLVAMGYPQDVIDDITVADNNLKDQNPIYNSNPYHGSGHDKRSKENEKVDYYDLYVTIDFDGDGVAETRHICFAGDIAHENILRNEYASSVPFADVISERNPHRWDGVSLSKDVIPMQRVITHFTRAAIDNVTLQNLRQPILNESSLVDLEAIRNPKHGMPILLNRGYKPEDIRYNEVPFVANNIMTIIDYAKNQIKDYTGINDASSGLPSDALQNVTAKASAMIEQSGIARVGMLTRNIAESLKRAFKGVLKLVIENQDKSRTIRLSGEWVEIDPRSWNSEMDLTVNTGLGAGTKERDVATMQAIIGMQEKIVSIFGADNPFVKENNLWAAVSDLVTASGLRTPELYFTKPNPEEIQAMIEAKRQSKPIEIQKIEAQFMADKALKEAELPFEMERARLEVAAAAEKERVQSQAAVDEAVEIAKIQASYKDKELALKEREIDARTQIELLKLSKERDAMEITRKDEIEKYQAEKLSEYARNAQPKNDLI